MVFVYNKQGKFIEIAESDQHIIFGNVNNDTFIEDSSCSTQEEFEKKYVFDGATGLFSVQINTEISAEHMAELIESTKMNLINSINEYADNKILYGVTVGNSTMSASDTQINNILFIIKSFEYGATSPSTIIGTDNFPIVISSIDEAKKWFTTLMAFRNNTLEWKLAVINDIKKLTTLSMIDAYQEKISFI